LSTSEPAVDRRSGLATVVDLVVSPSAAFTRLREAPTWGWALLIGTVLGVVGTILIIPAVAHVLDVTLPAKFAASPQIAQLSPEQQQSTIALQLKISHIIVQFLWVFVPIGILVGGVVQALLMLVANAIGGGDGGFKKYFALSVNVSVVGYGLAAALLGLIVTIRGASSFEVSNSVYEAMPSLALLAPGAKGFIAGCLAGVNIFTLWATALLALGMQQVGRVRVGAAWGMAIVTLLLYALYLGANAAQNA